MYLDRVNSNAGSLDYYVFRASLKRFQLPPSELPPAQYKEIQSLALREHALVSAVLSSEEARNLIIPDEILNTAIATLEARYECREDFIADLERNRLDKKVLRNALQCQLQVDAVLQFIASRAAPVTERDAERYYHLHKQRFEQPETRTARHILITVNDDFSENRPESAYARMNQILQSVRGKPSSFTEQARKYSECPSALRGGLLGRVPQGRLYPVLDKKLFSLCSGEISDVVHSPVGLHILLCQEIYGAKILPFEEVIPRIMEKLTERRQREYQQFWISSLRC